MCVHNILPRLDSELDTNTKILNTIDTMSVKIFGFLRDYNLFNSDYYYINFCYINNLYIIHILLYIFRIGNISRIFNIKKPR